MSKHNKPVKKWVAVLRDDWRGKNPNLYTVVTAEVDVIETKKQFRLLGGPMRMMPDDEARAYRVALEACGYRTHISKSDSCPLHDTEKAALVALDRYYERQLDNARAKVRTVATQYHVVSQHVEQKYANSD